MNDQFYIDFENRFRGSRDDIKQRFRFYANRLSQLDWQGSNNHIVLDLGCGRGEWIELMGELGFSCVGVDIDPMMVDACCQLGLNVVQAEALSYIKTLNDESVSVITAFHVVEHLDFNDLHELLRCAFRKLRPMGLLLLETPNPENIAVGTTNFYLDPTHKRPIPADLLEYVCNWHGFEQTIVLRLNEPPHLAMQQDKVSLSDIFYHASPDLAVIAQKAHPKAPAAEKVQALFCGQIGLTPRSLAEAVEHRIAADIRKTALRLEQHFQHEVEKVGLMLQLTNNELQSVYASRSWRITAPLRWVRLQLHKIWAEGLGARLRKGLRKFIRLALWHSSRLLANTPRLKYFVLLVIRRIGLYSRLRTIWRGESMRKLPTTISERFISQAGSKGFIPLSSAQFSRPLRDNSKAIFNTLKDTSEGTN